MKLQQQMCVVAYCCPRRGCHFGLGTFFFFFFRGSIGSDCTLNFVGGSMEFL